MFAEEWPLMMFTLLTQLAVGSFLMLVLIRTLLVKTIKQEANQFIQFGTKAVGIVMGIALVFSLFHLGTPTGAYRSILNLGSSWLSREILTAGGFFGLWFLTYTQLKKGNFNSILGWITAIIGLLAIYCMASIYATSVRPAWDNANTYLAFYGTTLLFGSVGATLSLLLGNKGMKVSDELGSILKKVSIIGLAAVIIPLVYLPVYISGLNGSGSAAMASAQMLSGTYAFTLIIRWILSVAGGILLTYFIFRQSNRQPASANLIYLAFAGVFIGEFIGRYVFYASAVSIMIGLN
jgi:anaerobic dimethyl sulfoxide reductase subunit C (anchor subunit)